MKHRDKYKLKLKEYKSYYFATKLRELKETYFNMRYSKRWLYGKR
jgi:ribosomal protein L29